MKKFTVQSLIAGIGVMALTTGVMFTSASAQEPQGPPPMRMHGRGPGGPGGPGGPMGPGFGRPMGPGGFMLGRLDLTEAQRGQVKAILDGHKADFDAIQPRMQEARKALQEAMDVTPVNEEGIRAASAAVAAIEADVNVLHASVRAEVFNILTDQQKAKAAELKAKADARRVVARERVKERVKARKTQPKGEL